jgi:DNA repair exonuclease SbcCD ATPase subunit
MAGNEGTVMNEPFKELLAQAAEERKVVQFTLRSGKWEMRLEKDIEDMTLPELEDYLAELESQLSTMDDDEPEDDSSDEYEAWAEAHEDLEDLIDDVNDRIEELS